MTPLTAFFRSHGLKIAAILLVVVAGSWLWRNFPAGKQVRSAQEELENAIMYAKWKRVDALLHPQFEDGWGLGREGAILALKDARAPFLNLTITGEESGVEINDGLADLKRTLRFEGIGNPLAQEIMRRGNQVEGPFVFIWEKTGWSPGSWKLRELSHPNLEIPSEYRDAF